jgi:hypothetical protein
LALAEELRVLLDARAVNQAGLAHLYGMTRARVTQILNLLRLRPAILAYLRQPDRPSARVSERRLRSLVSLSPEHQLHRVRLTWPGLSISSTTDGRTTS